MAILYTKQELSRSIPKYAKANLQDTSRIGRELKPTGNGWLNVIKDFPWTLTPKTSQARNETPFITLTEYYMIDSALNQQLLPYGSSGSVGSGLGGLAELADTTFDFENLNRLYEGLYDLIAPSGFKYYLPMFSPEHFTLNNSWERKDILDTVIDFQKRGFGVMSKIFGGIGGRVRGQGLAAKALRGVSRGAQEGANVMQALPDIIKQVSLLQLQSNNPAVGLFDTPHLWQGSTPRTYNISFYLYNVESTTDTTNNVNNVIQKNWEFCYILAYQNALNKRNFFTGYVPVFYEVFIPGVHYCKASYMKNITISNVGNTRKMRLFIDDGGQTDVNIPDAYKIDITMQDLLMPSKNLYSTVTSVNLQNVISTGRVNRDDSNLPAGD
jgi:hypothetical protein